MCLYCLYYIKYLVLIQTGFLLPELVEWVEMTNLEMVHFFVSDCFVPRNDNTKTFYKYSIAEK